MCYKKLKAISARFLKYSIALSFLLLLKCNALYAQDNDLDLAYNYLNNGNTRDAIAIFESYVKDNPNDTKIYLQLGYAYLNINDESKAAYYFNYVINYSSDADEISKAKKQLFYIDSKKKNNNFGNLNNNSLSNSNNNIDLAYSYLNNGQTRDAINLFESYIKENPTDTKVFLQLGYAYLTLNDDNTALNYFKYVVNYSNDADEISKAKNQLFYLDSKKKSSQEKSLYPVETANNYTLFSSTSSDDLDAAYRYLNEGIVDLAIPLFEKYLKSNPGDTKVHMQLGYVYSNKKNYFRALDHFEYVSANSRDNEEVDRANESIFILKQMIPMYSPASYDLYFYNIFDSYQQNYISNFVSHFNFRLQKFFYTGFYVDLYLDNRSKPGEIYNDRYFEGGAFWKFYFLNFCTFELRAGYVREIDFKRDNFNIKPILAFGYRVGNPKFYSGYTNRERDFMFMDIYATLLYDYKFKNAFGQGYLRETMRFLTGGYSYFDFYLFQTALADTKLLDYNNYGELGVGMGWKPGLISFPTLFVEASNKFYWIDNGYSRNSFQIKAGFLLNFNLGL